MTARELTQVRPPGPRGSGGDLSGDPLEEGTDFSAVFAATRGDHIGQLAMPVPEWDAPPVDDEERARRALHEVADPEFPISVVDLGLVYGVEVEGGHVTVRLTFTATACPCMDFIKWDVRSRLLEEEGFERVTVVETWDPPWTTERITERGREVLSRAGVSI